MRNLFYFLFLALIAVSCGDTDMTDDTLTDSMFAEEFTTDLIIETRSGQDGCFEVVFPIELMFPGGLVVDFMSFKDMKEAIRAWRLENPDVGERPKLVFPIDLINEDGDILTANNRHQLHRIVKHCRMQDRPSTDHYGDCFKIIFPIKIKLPDGTIKEIKTQADIKRIVRYWREHHPDSAERPRIVFPIRVAVQTQDAPIVIDSPQALRRLKESCRD